MKQIRDWIFNEKEWQEISVMNDHDLRQEFRKLLDETEQGNYQLDRFRRICYHMALRFDQQDQLLQTIHDMTKK